MTHRKWIPLALAVVLLAVPLLSGCLGTGGGGQPAGPSGEAPGPGAGGPGGSGTEATASPGQRPHVHDRWGDQTVKVLMNGTVRIDKAERFRMQDSLVNGLLCRTTNCQYRTVFTLPNGSIVPPGTKRLEVEASWSAASDVELAYRDANATRFAELAWKTSPATWTINTTVPMADDGHATLSLWRFMFTSCECGVAIPPSTARFDVDVKITAYRVNGSLPIAPPHPDWWADGPVRTIYEDSGSGAMLETGVVRATPSGELWEGPGQWIVGREHGILPPGTRYVTMAVNVTSEGRSTPEPLGTSVSGAWTTRYKPPAHDWEPSMTTGNRTVFGLAVSPRLTDGMYSNVSRWRFGWELRGQDGGVDEPLLGRDLGLPSYWEGSWVVTIRAYQEPPGELADG